MKALRLVFFFTLSGVIGFLVDSAALYLLKASVGLYFGRIVSFFLAVLATWVINRTLTYRDRESGLSKHNEFARYLGLMIGGGVLNFTVYTVLVGRFIMVNNYPVIGVAAGSLAGMAVNLITSRLLLYRFSIK